MSNISRTLEEDLKDLEFMRKIEWSCKEREYYEKKEEENIIHDRFEILDL